MKYPLRALIEGQLSALASLTKTGKCPLRQNFYQFPPKFVYNFDWRVYVFSHHH